MISCGLVQLYFLCLCDGKGVLLCLKFSPLLDFTVTSSNQRKQNQSDWSRSFVFVLKQN